MSEIAEAAEFAAERLEQPNAEHQAEVAWIRWRAERVWIGSEYDALLRAAFHAGFNRGRQV
jgi:hypothetical protein